MKAVFQSAAGAPEHDARDALIDKALATLDGLDSPDKEVQAESTRQRNQHVGALVRNFCAHDGMVSIVLISMMQQVGQKDMKAGLAFADFVSSEAIYASRKEETPPLKQLRAAALFAWDNMAARCAEQSENPDNTRGNIAYEAVNNSLSPDMRSRGVKAFCILGAKYSRWPANNQLK